MLGRDLGNVAYCYDTSLLLASFMPPKKQTTKLVLLLSSMHSMPTISENGRPEVVNYYNSTKGGVDSFDQLCGTYTCSRRTKRWPLCTFYSIINAATVNVWITHSENLEREGEKRTTDIHGKPGTSFDYSLGRKKTKYTSDAHQSEINN